MKGEKNGADETIEEHINIYIFSFILFMGIFIF